MRFFRFLNCISLRKIVECISSNFQSNGLLPLQLADAPPIGRWLSCSRAQHLVREKGTMTQTNKQTDKNARKVM